jgi:hypothetical protein
VNNEERLKFERWYAENRQVLFLYLKPSLRCAIEDTARDAWMEGLKQSAAFPPGFDTPTREPATYPLPNLEAGESADRLRKERNEWRRKYFEIERGLSSTIDKNGEQIKRIQWLEKEKDEIRNECKANHVDRHGIQSCAHE